MAIIQILTAFLTGHGPWRPDKIQIKEDELCRLCEEEDATAEYFICNCDVFAIIRFRHLHYAYLRAEELRTHVEGRYKN